MLIVPEKEKPCERKNRKFSVLHRLCERSAAIQYLIVFANACEAIQYNKKSLLQPPGSPRRFAPRDDVLLTPVIASVARQSRTIKPSEPFWQSERGNPVQ